MGQYVKEQVFFDRTAGIYISYRRNKTGPEHSFVLGKGNRTWMVFDFDSVLHELDLDPESHVAIKAKEWLVGLDGFRI